MTMEPLGALRPETPPPRLYAKRTAVFPRKIDGTFRRFKWAVMGMTLAIYWLTPWIRWDRGPFAPNQAVLIDLAHRRFYMFQIEIWPQEFYFVAGLLIMAGLGLFLVTSAVGRAWCGYACPQTVWTDLFQHVDRLIDGDRNAQARLNAAPWGPAKIGRRALKWGIYLLIAFGTGGAWIFYFADAPTLQTQFWTGTAAPVAYATTGVLTLTTFVLGGFMREQVCIYMCPWPRIQSAMLDENSLTVTYKDWRGEPRGKLKAPKLKETVGAAMPTGDCIDCGLCTAVCPTGIDIREGPQIGCITCGLCIDACDRTMASINRPRGLIDYATLNDAARERQGQPPRGARAALLHPRTLVYFGLWCGVGAALLFALGTRTRLVLHAAHDRNPAYVLMSDGRIRNAMTLRLDNMEARTRTLTLSAAGLPGARLFTDEMDEAAAAPALPVTLPADATTRLRLYVLAPAGSDDGHFALILTDPATHEPAASAKTRLMTPEHHGEHAEKDDD